MAAGWPLPEPLIEPLHGAAALAASTCPIPCWSLRRRSARRRHAAPRPQPSNQWGGRGSVPGSFEADDARTPAPAVRHTGHRTRCPDTCPPCRAPRSAAVVAAGWQRQVSIAVAALTTGVSVRGVQRATRFRTQVAWLVTRSRRCGRPRSALAWAGSTLGARPASAGGVAASGAQANPPTTGSGSAARRARRTRCTRARASASHAPPPGVGNQRAAAAPAAGPFWARCISPLRRAAVSARNVHADRRAAMAHQLPAPALGGRSAASQIVIAGYWRCDPCRRRLARLR